MARAKCPAPHQGMSKKGTFFYRIDSLSQYDRVDPAEIQGLRDEITQLKQEAASAQEKLTEKEGVAETSTQRVCSFFIRVTLLSDLHLPSG